MKGLFILFLVWISVIITLGGCSLEDTLQKRTQQNFLADIEKVFPYLNEITILDTSITVIGDKICFIDFTLTGKDTDGNTLTGRWSYNRSNLLGGESEDNVFVRLREKDALLKDSLLYTYYPLSLKEVDKLFSSGKEDKTYLKCHKTKGDTWYELINNGKHGLVAKNGAIVELPLYDSIKYRTEAFPDEYILYYKYKAPDDTILTGRSILDKDMYPIVPYHYFAKYVQRIPLPPSQRYYYSYSFYNIYDVNKSKNTSYFGAIDRRGEIIYLPIYEYIHYIDNEYPYITRGSSSKIDAFRFRLSWDHNLNQAHFPTMISSYCIDRETNTCAINDDFKVIYYEFVKEYKHTFTYDRLVWRYQGENDYYRNHICLIFYNNKIYCDEFPYDSPLVLKYSSENSLFFHQEKPFFDHFDSNKDCETVYEITSGLNELIVHSCDGEEIYYRTVSDYEFEKQNDIIEEREEKYTDYINKLAELNGISKFRKGKNYVK